MQCCIPDPTSFETFSGGAMSCNLAATTSMHSSEVHSLCMIDLSASFSGLVHRAKYDFAQFVVEGDRFPKISSEIDLTHQN